MFKNLILLAFLRVTDNSFHLFKLGQRWECKAKKFVGLFLALSSSAIAFATGIEIEHSTTIACGFQHKVIKGKRSAVIRRQDWNKGEICLTFLVLHNLYHPLAAVMKHLIGLCYPHALGLSQSICNIIDTIWAHILTCQRSLLSTRILVLLSKQRRNARNFPWEKPQFHLQDSVSSFQSSVGPYLPLHAIRKALNPSKYFTAVVLKVPCCGWFSRAEI